MDFLIELSKNKAFKNLISKAHTKTTDWTSTFNSFDLLLFPSFKSHIPYVKWRSVPYNRQRTTRFHPIKAYGIRTMFIQSINLETFLAYGKDIYMPSHVSKMNIIMTRDPALPILYSSTTLLLNLQSSSHKLKRQKHQAYKNIPEANDTKHRAQGME